MTTRHGLRYSAALIATLLVGAGCGTSDPTDPTSGGNGEVAVGRPCNPTGLFEDGRGEVVDRTWTQLRTREFAARMTPLELDELARGSSRPACAFGATH